MWVLYNLRHRQKLLLSTDSSTHTTFWTVWFGVGEIPTSPFPCFSYLLDPLKFWVRDPKFKLLKGNFALYNLHLGSCSTLYNSLEMTVQKSSLKTCLYIYVLHRELHGELFLKLSFLFTNNSWSEIIYCWKVIEKNGINSEMINWGNPIYIRFGDLKK